MAITPIKIVFTALALILIVVQAMGFDNFIITSLFLMFVFLTYWVLNLKQSKILIHAVLFGIMISLFIVGIMGIFPHYPVTIAEGVVSILSLYI
ncbi:MAG: hypothetical protein LBM27_00580 [Lactobacillaceae bacterium]|jgi:hypothetical protein|nr:hypothetical protein [Lactobacillaceae bacterium]